MSLGTSLGDPVQLTLSWDGEAYSTLTPSGTSRTTLVQRVGLALALSL